MLSRKENIVPEILKRFKNKNTKILNFCLSTMNQALLNNHLQIQDANLKMIFKSTHDLLGHSAKEIRDLAIQLISIVYENCEDDLETFCANCKGLRPVQHKDLKEQLSTLQKNQRAEYLVKLFDQKVAASESRKDLAVPEKSPVGRSKSTESQKQVDDEADVEHTQADLLNLVPQNFNEIAYLNQINVKRKSMEQFNQELETLIKN